MIIFHEGLPRSGKSYEAMVKHVIPALQAGRPVQAYIAGLDFELIASVAEIDIQRCKELLTQIHASEVKEVWKWAKDNALIVIDEVQNFWRTGRGQLSDDITNFVTEHGHRGIDLLIMGQSLKDVHALWRRRVQRKVMFNKLDMLGMENKYVFRVFAATAPEVFEQVASGRAEYDKRYFGTYASHVSEAIQTGNYRDKRFLVWNTPAFKFGIPACLLFSVWAIWHLYGFFHPSPKAKPALLSDAVTKPASPRAPAHPSVSLSAPVAASAPVATSNKRDDGFLDSLKQWRPRVAASLSSGSKTQVVIDWMDSTRVMERLTATQLRELGYEVTLVDGVAFVRKESRVVLVATPWPLDPLGHLTNSQTDSLRDMAKAAPVEQVAGTAPVAGSFIDAPTLSASFSVGKKP